ncbi:MAG TPA: hypothetical protein DCY18_17355 [Thauera sp.]|nr:hypothetical protein [Thauera sp.]
MPWDLYVKVITEARGLPDFTTICYSGGEPFQRYPHLLRAARLARDETSFRITINTSAVWAKSDAVVSHRLAELDGLRKLGISYDMFHSRVPFANVERSVAIANDMGVECDLKICRTGIRERDAPILERAAILAGRYDNCQLLLADLFSTARSDAAGFNPATSPYYDPGGIQCGMPDQVFVVTVSGEVYNCCGALLMQRDANPFYLGNAYDESFPRLVELAERSSVIQLFKTHSLAEIEILLMEETGGELDVDRGNMCEHCKGLCRSNAARLGAVASTRSTWERIALRNALFFSRTSDIAALADVKGSA